MRARALMVLGVLGGGCVGVDAPAIADDVVADVPPPASEDASAPLDVGGSGGAALPPSEFPLLWAVHTPAVPVPTDGLDVRLEELHAVTLSQDLGSVIPSAVGDDVGAFIDAMEADIRAQIPADARGIGLLPRAWWRVPWCGLGSAYTDQWKEFMGGGLSEDEYAASWEDATVTLRVSMLERAKQVRPDLRWTVDGIPYDEYWPLVRESSDVETWRACLLDSPPVRAVVEEVDVLAFRLRAFYAAGNETQTANNYAYVERQVEGALRSGKPVYPIFDGRYDNPSEDMNGRPLTETDVQLMISAARLAGADGFVYRFSVEGCWDDTDCAVVPAEPPEALFRAYWEDTVAPVLAAWQ